jgi:methionyl-tRNA formyltransferase
VHHAILHGDEITGATTFRIVTELDAGPVYGVVTEPISAFDTSGALLERLSVSGAELLVRTLDGIESGTLAARPQPPDGVSYAPKLSRADARVSWKLPAAAIDRLIRACTPAPGAWTTFNGSTVKLGPVLAAEAGEPAAGPGEIRVEGSRVLVGTGTAPVALGEVHPEGKRQMPAADWARGLRAARPALAFG